MTRRWSSGARPARPAAAAPGEDSNGTIGEYCSGTDTRSGYLAKGGQIVDAIIIQAPRQRNNQEEKDGEIPQDWKEKSAKLARYILFPSATCQ